MGYIGATPTAVPLTGADIVDDSIESVDIKAGTIVNSDINASAAIVTSKVSGAVTSIASHGLATSATTDTTNAANISSGTIPEARIATLDATKLTGTINNARISLDAAEIPNLDTAKVTTGTFADARFPATLPAVSGANLTSLTAGNITGVVPAANLGTGTANSTTFLNGSGAYSEAGGGAWTLINSGTASNVASLTVTGMDHTTYDTHVLVFSRFQPATSGQNLNLRVRRSSDGRIESLSQYCWHLTEAGDNTTSGNGITGQNQNYARIAVEPHNFGSNVGGAGGTLYFTNADTTDQHITWYGTFGSGRQGGVTGSQICGIYNGDEGNGSDIDGINLYFNSGNIVSGRLSLFGIKHT